LLSIGTIDPNTVVKVVKEVTEEDKRRQVLMDARPPLDEILNLHDFEVRLSSVDILDQSLRRSLCLGCGEGCPFTESLGLLFFCLG
jgi:hypothetical protein